LVVNALLRPLLSSPSIRSCLNQHQRHHRPREAAEEFHIAVVDDDRSRAETNDGVAVGRNALVDPAEGGKYQPLGVNRT
jgi:hypothetical protein